MREGKERERGRGRKKGKEITEREGK